MTYVAVAVWEEERDFLTYGVSTRREAQSELELRGIVRSLRETLGTRPGFAVTCHIEDGDGFRGLGAPADKERARRGIAEARALLRQGRAS